MTCTMKILFAIASITFAAQTQAGDFEAGKKKAAEVCAACHGPDGNSPVPDFPRLAGQYEDYIVASLKKYKNGKRTNPIMVGMAATLSEEDVKNVATYFSRQTGLNFKH